MSNFDYKKYSLENLENWMHDAMSCEDATPQEIYDVIVGVVKENYYYHKDQTSRAYELLCKLNGNNGQSYEDVIKEREYYESSMTEEELLQYKTDKVVKWKLPVQVDGLTGECYVNFPDDLLEAANLQEGDQVQWIDNQDGSFTLKKVIQPLGMDEC